MRITGRLCTLALSSMVVAGLFATTPASADNAEAYAGSAAARALNLDVLGIKLTAGSTDALANSSPAAHANGSGLGLIADSTSKADATAGQDQSSPKACALNLPISGILTVALACSQSSASAIGGNPLAASSADVAAIDVGLVNLVLELLQPILDALTPVLDQVIGTVTGTLQPLIGGALDPLLGNLGLNLNSPVRSLVDALKNVTNLATVHVGDTTSSATTDAGKVTALATAKGGEVDVLPGLGMVGAAPLLSIVLGSATASSTFDRTTGQSAASFDPSLLTLQVLGVTVPVGLGAPITLFPGTLLESTISIGAGHTISNPDGTVGAVADGVSLQLLKGVSGGITLELAHAESAVGGAKALITAQSVNPPAPPAEVKAAELARTGAEAPWLPMGMMLILAAFVTRRVTRARR